MSTMNNLFPIYIVSKGRWDSRLTVKALEGMGIPYHIVVEEQEFGQYAQVIDAAKILVLDKAYQRDYDPFDSLGDSISKGSGPARNFAWDHSIANGHSWHWLMDDNIRHFYRVNNNLKVRVKSGVFFRVIEDFVLRYTNIGMAGPNYEKFAPRKLARPAYQLNTRIFSCNLIRNDLPFHWRGRFNEDADLSLRILKAGWVTMLFNAYLAEKLTTQTLKGGNTEVYKKEGTLIKSRMLVAMHPDLTRVVWKFHRWHHVVDYSVFQQKLLRRADLEVAPGANEYGMELLDLRQKAPE